MMQRRSRSTNRTIYISLMILCIVGFWVFENFYTPDKYSNPANEVLTSKVPDKILPASTSGEIVNHSNYILSYKERYEQAEWVAYVLKRSHLT
ncbi:MAG: DNA/RNA non-specific endonuclease, partial [Eudoraea sp.]|nr:DNA/RNA non-specific endonuclease [Eudoraea sp.]